MSFLEQASKKHEAGLHALILDVQKSLEDNCIRGGAKAFAEYSAKMARGGRAGLFVKSTPECKVLEEVEWILVQMHDSGGRPIFTEGVLAKYFQEEARSHEIQ